MIENRHYTTLLMDIDDTIFDFPKCEYQALREALTAHGLAFTDEICETFSAVNAALWKKFEMNQITRSELRVRRFQQLIEQCFEGYDNAVSLANQYVACLGEQVIYIDGAEEAVRRLHGVYAVYVITNGLKTVQRRRLEKSGLKDLTDGVFISDEMGVQKPMKAFFDRVLSEIAEKDPSRILVVGDSLTSDMQGGRNAGLDTCLYDPKHKVSLPHPLCDFRIERLAELLAFQ